jgi:hypothetical protein
MISTDEQIRKLERALIKDSTDTNTRHALGAARFRIGRMPQDDESVLFWWINEKRIGADRVAMAVRLGFDLAKVACDNSESTKLRKLKWEADIIKKLPLSLRHLVSMVSDFIEVTLPIFERVRPDDKTPRIAIQALRNWVSSPTERNRSVVAAAHRVAWRQSNSLENKIEIRRLDDDLMRMSRGPHHDYHYAQLEEYRLLQEREGLRVSMGAVRISHAIECITNAVIGDDARAAGHLVEACGAARGVSLSKDFMEIVGSGPGASVEALAYAEPDEAQRFRCIDYLLGLPNTPEIAA